MSLDLISSPSSLTSVQRERLGRALESLNAQYNPVQRALRLPFSSPGYHTVFKGSHTHPTRESLHYAVALLDADDDEFCRRAQDILHRVVSEQDQDPDSKTYGIWSWFLDEPLSEMSPPDWNWADFCGVALLQVALDHRERISPELLKRIDDAIVHAARSIIRRNVGPHYTNIAIMGTYVTLIAAELYELADMKDYVIGRLRRFHEYTLAHGAFTEFNSPTYTIVAISELGRLRLHARDPEAQQMIEDLYHRAWEEAAHHFHPPTRQWAGPHSRAYGSLLWETHLAVIERSVSRPLGWEIAERAPSIDEHRLPLPCPTDLEECFVALDGPRRLVKTFLRDTPPVVGSTYLTEQFALGSVNRGDLWNQRRSLIAYWGTVQKPNYLHVRFLHDDYDFAAAQFFSAQNAGRVLGGVNFASDGGDTHLIFDRLQNGQLKAKSLRLRFEFGGAGMDEHPLPKTAATEPIQLSFGPVRVELSALFAAFGDERAQWKVVRQPGLLCIDLVLYEGPERAFSLPDLDAAVVGFTVEMSAEPREAAPVAAPAAELTHSRLNMEWTGLKLSIPARSATVDALQHG
jgi:hypothetical protein